MTVEPDPSSDVTVPLTAAEIRAIIYIRIDVAAKSCNSYHRASVFGQLTGLLFALTGNVHFFNERSSTADVLTAARIPFSLVQRGDESATVETSDLWMQEHGFAQEADGSYGSRHPRFSELW